jgi:aryl-alcohol dehydrogenase-like predicted oxidoreductase
VLSRGGDVVPIPGTKKVSRIEENAAAAFVQLTAEDIATLESIVPEAKGDRYGSMDSTHNSRAASSPSTDEL